MAGLAPPSSFPMAGLEPPSTYPMDAAAPTSIISMDAAAPPSTSIVAAPAPPSTSPTAAPVPPSTSPTATPAPPSNSSTVGPEQPFISSMPAPAAPPSTSTMAVTGDARKKRPRRELPRSGCKKNKKIAVVQEEPAKETSPLRLTGSVKRKLKKQKPKKEDSNGDAPNETTAEKEQEAPIEQEKIETTLEEYEKMQEKKKSLEASKPEERRVAAVDFEGLQLLEKKKIEDDAKLKAKKVRKTKEAAAKEAKPCKRASPRVYSPKIVASSPGVNMLARSAALKRVSSAVWHASAKRAKLADQLETPASQRTPLQNTPSLQNLSPAARRPSSHGSKRRRRKLVSRIWEEAEPIYDGQMLVEGQCNHCQQIFPATRDTGTSHLRQHLKVCPMKSAMNEMIDKLGPPKVVDPNWKFDPKVSRFELVKLIVVNELPFSLAEYKPFRDFAASLNPWFKVPSRTTVKDDCMANFKRNGLNMQQYFEKSTSRVSLTADMWTSNQKLGDL